MSLWQEQEVYEVRRATYVECQRNTLLLLQQWVVSLRDVGIPILGQFQEMTPSNYTSPEDCYLTAFAELSCQYSCSMHNNTVNEKYRSTVYVYIAEYDNDQVWIEKRDQQKPYHITFGGLGGEPLKGLTWWDEHPPGLTFENAKAIALHDIAKFGCSHLKEVFALEETIEAMLALNILAMSSE